MYDPSLKDALNRKVAEVEVAQSRYRVETDACATDVAPSTFTNTVIERLHGLTAELLVANQQLEKTIARNMGTAPTNKNESLGAGRADTQPSATFPAISSAIDHLYEVAYRLRERAEVLQAF